MPGSDDSVVDAPAQHHRKVNLRLGGNLDVIIVARMTVATRHGVGERKVQRVHRDALSLRYVLHMCGFYFDFKIATL